MTFNATVRASHRLFPYHGAGAVLLLSFAVGCKEKPRPQRAIPVVSIANVTKGPLPYVIVATGEVEPNRTVSVQSLVSGMITQVGITEGQEVRQGQMLFQIDPRPFSAELQRVRATLARDEATLTRSRSDSARFAALAKDGYVTRQQLDQSFGEVNALAATVDAGRASVERARLDLENTTVRAPISGRTGQIALRTGNLVRAQADPPLVVINELRPVLVRFSVPERDFEEMRRRAGLDQALRVKITPGQGADSLRATFGTLTFINNAVDRATGSVLLKARVENQDRLLWPGQFVQVALELSVDADAITVPTEAVITTPNGAFVFVVDDSSKAHRSPIKAGRTVGQIVKIDSGLTGAERIVIEGQNRLTDGAAVQQRDTSRAAAGGRAGGSRGGRGAGGRKANAGAADSAGRSSQGGARQP